MSDISALQARGIRYIALVDADGVAVGGTATLAELRQRGMTYITQVDADGLAGSDTLSELRSRGIPFFCEIDENGADPVSGDTLIELARRGITGMCLVDADGIAQGGSSTMAQLRARGIPFFCPLDEDGNETSLGPVILLAGNDVDEDASIGDLVGTFSIGSPSGNWLDPITYTLTDDAGGLFAIDGDDLEVAGALDYETDTFHSITVEADNGTDAPITRTFSILVNDADEITPSLLSLSPADNATSVPVATHFVAIFNEDIAFGATVDIGLYLTDDTPVEVWDETDVGGGINIANNFLTINPTSDLTSGEGYYVLISAGSIEDLAGNAFAGIAEGDWSFATADVTSPVISSLLPADNATGVLETPTIIATFDEPIIAGASASIGIYLMDDTPVEVFDETDFGGALIISSDQLTITLASPLSATTEYYILIAAGSVEDASANAFAGLAKGDWTFTTGDGSYTPSLDFSDPQNSQYIPII